MAFMANCFKQATGQVMSLSLLSKTPSNDLFIFHEYNYQSLVINDSVSLYRVAERPMSKYSRMACPVIKSLTNLQADLLRFGLPSALANLHRPFPSATTHSNQGSMPDRTS